VDLDDLLDALRARAGDPERATDGAGAVKPKHFPPVAAADVAEVERTLGLRLPPPLVAIYTRVANGGFGPAYGLLGLPGGATEERKLDAVGLYFHLRLPAEGDPLWSWPRHLLPVGHLGCGMYACVDCSTDDGAVVWFEPNPHADGEPWDDAFIPLAPSLAMWLENWLAGVDMFESAWNAAGAT
jgi:hypothetical protein